MRRTLVPLALLLVVALPALGALDGSISGVVKDSSGGVLPGVAVTAKGPVLQGIRTAVTRSDGTYRLPSLPAGDGYTIEFALSGFRSVSRAAVAVRLNQDTQINPVMQLAEIQAEVVVTSETPVVDATQTNTAQAFSNEALKRLPVGSTNRTYQNILQQAPGVVGGGNPNVMGGNIMENSFQVDGVNTTDPVTHTFSFNLNFDAIQEVSLQTSGYAAEFGRASGGIVNVVTKSGGNTFSGSFDIRWNGSDLAETGDYFDPDFTPYQNVTANATLGGPILKDRLWFFANVGRPDNYSTPATTNATILAQVPTAVKREFEGWNYGGKLSFTPSEKINGFFSYNNAEASIPGSSNSASVRPEAASIQDQLARIYTLKGNAVLSDSWLAEIQIGRSESSLTSQPMSGDLSKSLWINYTQGSVYYDNYNNYQTSDRNRNILGLSSAYFLSAAGTHELKVGFDADRTEFPSTNFSTGTPSDPSFCSRDTLPGTVCGALFYFRGFDTSGNRVPWLQYVYERTPERERNGRSYAVYLQDQWRPNPRLTVNLGLRWDRNEYYNNEGKNAINFDKLQPRVSVAYDVTGDGKTVARANYGLFYVDAALTLARLFDTGIYSPYTGVYQWSASQQRYVLVQTSGGVSQGIVADPLIDSPLDPTYDEQINVAVEREVVRNLSVTATYLYKKTKDIYEDTCTDQEECPDYWLSNFPGRGVPGIDETPLTKEYYGYMFQAEWRLPGGRGLVNASYTYSKSRGSIDSSSGQFAGGDFDYYPYNFVNRYGYLGDDARNRFKVFGSYRIPWVEMNLGVSYLYRSGFPYTTTEANAEGYGTVFVEPRGSRRGPISQYIDLSLDKPFTLFKSFTVSVIGSVYNLTNNEYVTSIGSSLGSPSTLYKPLSYARPRSYELGFRLEF